MGFKIMVQWSQILPIILILNNVLEKEKGMNRRQFLQLSVVLSSASILAACSRGAKSYATQSVPPEVRVLAEGLNFPEGPAFDPAGGLWCTEMGAGNLVRWQDGRIERIPTEGRPNGLAFDQQGRAWVPDSQLNSIRRYTPENGLWETILERVDGMALQAPNDLTFDARGNLIFTCPNYATTERTGYVVCLRPDGSARRIAEGYYRPNGLDIVDGGKALVVADTYQKALFKGRWDDERCTWEDVHLWAQVGGTEGPDGMAPGANGYLYQAIYGDGMVQVIGPDGKTVEKFSLPGKNPTNVAIDPSGRLGLVVTEAEKGLLLSIPDIQPGPAIYLAGEVWP